jgi:hypothetical protein
MGGHKFSLDLNIKHLERIGEIYDIAQNFNCAYAIIRIMKTEVGLIL